MHALDHLVLVLVYPSAAVTFGALVYVCPPLLPIRQLYPAPVLVLDGMEIGFPLSFDLVKSPHPPILHNFVQVM
eukprot:Skav232837  [mRNA]  locus=scaffold2600:413929:414150:- [translate_table: standard]